VTDAPLFARAMWTLYEPVHAVTYFSAEPRAAFEAAGLRGYWRGYFGGRAAPLGPVGAAPVIALFNGFAPGMVQRALPAVWSLADPATVLDARAAGAAAALRRLAPDAAVVEPAVAALEDVAARLEWPGRPLGAANADLPRRTDPYERLWQATATLREHRGDGHVAALVAAGLDGLPMLVLRGARDIGRDQIQPARGWTDEEWDAAAARLTDQGLLDTAGAITDEAQRCIVDVERATDQAAAGAWATMASDEITLVAKALLPITRACVAELPERTPIGVIRPWDVALDPEATSVGLAI
jgi:helix-turn-helix protein